MYYAIMSANVADSLSKRQGARSEHLKQLHQLADQKRSLVAGPHPASDSAEPGDAGFSGSLIIAESDTPTWRLAFMKTFR